MSRATQHDLLQYYECTTEHIILSTIFESLIGIWFSADTVDFNYILRNWDTCSTTCSLLILVVGHLPSSDSLV